MGNGVTNLLESKGIVKTLTIFYIFHTVLVFVNVCMKAVCCLFTCKICINMLGNFQRNKLLSNQCSTSHYVAKCQDDGSLSLKVVRNGIPRWPESFQDCTGQGRKLWTDLPSSKCSHSEWLPSHDDSKAGDSLLQCLDCNDDKPTNDK